MACLLTMPRGDVAAHPMPCLAFLPISDGNSNNDGMLRRRKRTILWRKLMLILPDNSLYAEGESRRASRSLETAFRLSLMADPLASEGNDIVPLSIHPAI